MNNIGFRGNNGATYENKVEEKREIEAGELNAVKAQAFKEILDYMNNLYISKNTDYGDSVGDTYYRFGDISFLVRITDKYNRICSLIDMEHKGESPNIDEKIEDTILDMANYCVLWLVERVLEIEEVEE